MKIINKEKFDKQNVYGLGQENMAFAQYFIGSSYLNPLKNPKETWDRRRGGFMKKTVVSLLVTGMLVSLTACGSRTARDDSENGEAVAADNEFIPEETDNSTELIMEDNAMKITAGDTTFTAVLADNSSAEALKELLAEGPLTIDMSDYASMEKVGPIGTDLPRNDEQITTGAGDIILYQGNSLVIYYNTNSWNFTRIGKIEGVTGEELLEALGSGDVTVTFSLERKDG